MPATPIIRTAIREGIVLSALSLVLALFYNGVTGKGVFAGDWSRPSKSPLAAAAPEIISLETAADLQRSGAALFVDSRHAFDFRLGHIVGAINIPLQESDAAIAVLAQPKGRTIVVYCDGKECKSRLDVGSKLTAAGYGKVLVFFAGWSAWKQAGLPVTEGAR